MKVTAAPSAATRKTMGGRFDLLFFLVIVFTKILVAITCLYFFICSLTFLSLSFRMVGGKNLSSLISSSELLSNPVVGVMIGILVTVAVQSSSTSTSIIVSLVSAGVEVRHAIPLIMGSNVGTSVTNTVVAVGQAGDPDVFRRAFAAATIHDVFNWLSVVILLAFELPFHVLERLTEVVVDALPLEVDATHSPDLLKPLTKPFVDRIVQIDSKILVGWSVQDPKYENFTTVLLQNDNYLISYLGPNGLDIGDTFCGVVLLILALSLLIGCLLLLMKILNSILGSQMAIFIQRVINAEIPYVPWLTGYLAMLIGAVITILVRSSSVFTSTLTPLCGTGLVTLETAYPMTLGSNIGTTTTSILASFAAEGKYLKPSIQISFVHLFFNVIGILIFYPIPWMRWPIPLAKRLGDITARYRWFAGLYLIVTFFAVPGFIFTLSLAGMTFMYSVTGLVFLLIIGISLINFLQNVRPHWLPHILKNWDFLPEPLRSLDPYDRVIMSSPCCSLCCSKCIRHNHSALKQEGAAVPEVSEMLIRESHSTPIIVSS